MLSRMDARQHRDLIHTIVQALMDARYTPLKRRKSAWREGYDEDLARARRVAEAIVNALHTANFRINRKPARATPQHAARAMTFVCAVAALPYRSIRLVTARGRSGRIGCTGPRECEFRQARRW
jgi:hypothetical protein